MTTARVVIVNGIDSLGFDIELLEGKDFGAKRRVLIDRECELFQYWHSFGNRVGVSEYNSLC